MPSISSCPACHRDLTLPDSVGQKPLRCPLCDAQFTADQVLADSVPFPPLAIVVEAEEPAEETIETERPQYSPGADAPGAAAAPAWQEAMHSSADADVSTAAPADASAPADAMRQDLSADIEADRVPDDGETATAGYAEFEPQVSAMRVAPRVRRQASPLAMLGQVVGMALGGVLGLAIGYWVLLWLGGTQADFLELRGKLPRWILPPTRRHDAGLQVPLTKDKEKPGTSEPDRNFIDLAAWPSATDTPAVESLADDSDGMPLQSVPGDVETESLAPVETEPAAVDRPQPAPNVLPAGYFGPREFKLRTATDLRATIEQTELALRCPRCQMPGAVRLVSFESANGHLPGGTTSPLCEACRGKPSLHLGAAGFAQLCELGEAVTFVQFDEEGAEREQLRDAAETILIAVGNQRDKRETVGRLAGAWLEDGQRQTDGIVIAGTIEDARPQGDLFAIRIMLLSCAKHVEVVSRQSPEPALHRRDHVIMLGSIVDNPEDNLVGYAGEAQQVIWGGLHLKVAQ